MASTTAIASGTTGADASYTSIETRLTDLGARRDLLAEQIATLLDGAEFSDREIDGDQVQSLIRQGQAILADAHSLATGH